MPVSSINSNNTNRYVLQNNTPTIEYPVEYKNYERTPKADTVEINNKRNNTSATIGIGTAIVAAVISAIAIVKSHKAAYTIKELESKVKSTEEETGKIKEKLKEYESKLNEKFNAEEKPKLKPIPKDNFIDSEVPILSDIKPRKVFDGYSPKDWTREEIITMNSELKKTGKMLARIYDEHGKLTSFSIRTFDKNGNHILEEFFAPDNSLLSYDAITKDGHHVKFQKTGKIFTDYGESSSIT